MKKYLTNFIAFIRGFCFYFFSIFSKRRKANRKLRLFRFVSIDVDRGGHLSFGKNVKIKELSSVIVRKDSNLLIGDNVSIGRNNIIACHKKVVIGDGTLLSPNVLIFDHDHHFDCEGIKRKEFKSSPVIIGKNCWIGANTIILKGSIIGDNCIIGAGCVIKGNYPSNSLVVQKRESEIINIK